MVFIILITIRIICICEIIQDTNKYGFLNTNKYGFYYLNNN